MTLLRAVQWRRPLAFGWTPRHGQSPDVKLCQSFNSDSLPVLFRFVRAVCCGERCSSLHSMENTQHMWRMAVISGFYYLANEAPRRLWWNFPVVLFSAAVRKSVDNRQKHPARIQYVILVTWRRVIVGTVLFLLVLCGRQSVFPGVLYWWLRECHSCLLLQISLTYEYVLVTE